MGRFREGYYRYYRRHLHRRYVVIMIILGIIDGITFVETQTFTLMPM